MSFLIALALASTAIGVPQRVNANVSIAADGPFVAVTWSATAPSGPADIFAAVSTDGGRTFGAPVRVNDIIGDSKVNGEQPPRIALTKTAGAPPAITIVWPTKGANGTKLVQARSSDGGRTFMKAETIPASDAPGSRGWQGIAANSRGGVDVVWLDHRELAQDDAAMPAMHHEMASAEKPDGVAMAQKSKLYFAALDGSAPAKAITGGVCYCCKTAIAVGADGSINIAWRHVYPGNLRDMAFTVSRDGGRTFAAPIRVSEDKWVLEGCPDDGPSMAIDGQNRIHVVWPTLLDVGNGEPNLALFYAMSRDGKSFTPRQRIPTEGTPHHPQIAIDAKGRLTVTWDELVNGRRHIAFARAAAGPSGTPSFARQVISESEAAVYPMAAVTSAGEALVAWTSGVSAESVIRIARVP